MQPHHLVPSILPPSLDELIRKAGELALASRAPSSVRAYRSDIRDVNEWLRAHGFQSITPEVVALYLADKSGTLSPATLARRLADS
jgi:site-specific recombinase XerD